jgi:16S rRNA (cytidine1402-2'-O)-methyltransferase
MNENKEGSSKKGSLYVVATPIGNLEDITLRALRVLKEVSLIAAEDTRRTKKLLNAYEIHTPLMSLYDQVERSKSPILISKMKEGEDIAYVSDAGTPGISDPGYILINQALADGIRVIPVPGPSAVVTALSAAGLPMGSFIFIGFISGGQTKRRHLLESLANETRTLVFYESPRRIMNLLKEISDIFGNRQVVLARELTKVFEEIQRGKVDELLERLHDRHLKGEITLIIAGKGKGEDAHSPVLTGINSRFIELGKTGADLSTKDVIRKISAETGIPRKKVYQEVLRLIEEADGWTGEKP